MQFSSIDFLIGFFLMNAMPHLLFGLLRIRFFSALGFSAAGNLGYFVINVVVALVLFHIEHGIANLGSSGIFLGAGAMLFIYLVTGRMFYNKFNPETAIR